MKAFKQKSSRAIKSSAAEAVDKFYCYHSVYPIFVILRNAKHDEESFKSLEIPILVKDSSLRSE